MCGVDKEHHDAKAHPFTTEEITASYVAVALHGATYEENIREAVQRAARDAFVEQQYEVFDVDARRALENATKPGRVVVELETGGGLVGEGADPSTRIYVRQNESWVQQFATLVAMSEHVWEIRPELHVGQQVIVTRCAGEEFLLSVKGFSIPARFTLLHVSDVEGIIHT